MPLPAAPTVFAVIRTVVFRAVRIKRAWDMTEEFREWNRLENSVDHPRFNEQLREEYDWERLEGQLWDRPVEPDLEIEREWEGFDDPPDFGPDMIA